MGCKHGHGRVNLLDPQNVASTFRLNIISAHRLMADGFGDGSPTALEVVRKSNELSRSGTKVRAPNAGGHLLMYSGGHRIIMFFLKFIYPLPAISDWQYLHISMILI